MTEEHRTPEQRRATLELLEKSALTDYPNPDRIGCPGSAFLKTLATDRKSILISDSRLEHVARCSPCFGEFVKYRDAAKHRITSRRAFIGVGAAAAAALAAFAIRSTLGPMHLQYAHAEIDLLNAGAQRGADSEPSSARVDLPRKPLELAITPPYASPAGEYEVQVLHRDGAHAGVKSSGNAYR